MSQGQACEKTACENHHMCRTWQRLSSTSSHAPTHNQAQTQIHKHRHTKTRTRTWHKHEQTNTNGQAQTETTHTDVHKHTNCNKHTKKNTRTKKTSTWACTCRHMQTHPPTRLTHTQPASVQRCTVPHHPAITWWGPVPDVAGHTLTANPAPPAHDPDQGMYNRRRKVDTSPEASIIYDDSEASHDMFRSLPKYGTLMTCVKTLHCRTFPSMHEASAHIWKRTE
jgi:hypothetical protein